MTATDATPISAAAQKQADDFLTFFWNTYATRRKKYRYIRKAKFFQDEQTLEDIFFGTVVKVVNRIYKGGWECKYPGTYFDNAFETNVLSYLSKEAKKTVKQQSPRLDWLRGDEETQDDVYTELYPQPSEHDKLATATQAAVDALPQKYKEIIGLVVDGMRYKEIQRILRLRPAQVKMRIMTARKMVKASLLQAGFISEITDTEDDFDDEFNTEESE